LKERIGLFKNESRFTIFKNDGPGRVWRTPGTRFNIENKAPSVKYGGGGLMMWGCFSGKGLGPLVKVEGKMNRFDYIQILETHLLPLISRDFGEKGYLFQDDNAPIHTAKDVNEWVAERKIRTLPNWPNQSPDLNLLNIHGQNWKDALALFDIKFVSKSVQIEDKIPRSRSTFSFTYVSHCRANTRGRAERILTLGFSFFPTRSLITSILR